MASANNGLTRVFESMRLNQEWGHGYKSSLNEKIDRSISGFTFIVGVSIHPKDNENDFLEINFYFLFLVLHIKIY